MRMKKAGLLAAAVTFARSQKGQQLVQQAREKVDTPANRDKLKRAVSKAKPPGR